MSLDIATVSDRVDPQFVRNLNNLSSQLSDEFITPHLDVARIKIKLELGENFTITDSSYQTLYDHCIAKKTYAIMLPFMHVFYKQDFEGTQAELDEFYLSPNQIQTVIATLEKDINQNIKILKDEGSISNDKVQSAGGVILAAAGGNPTYKTIYVNEDIDG